MLVWDSVMNRGPIGNYRRINGGDLAAMIAFNALAALAPMLLLLVAFGGLVLQDQARMDTVSQHITDWLPAGQAREAAGALIGARERTTQLGGLALLGLLWIGTSFTTTLARAMDRIYGVPGRNFVHNRLLAFFVVIIFTLFLILSSITAATASFVNRSTFRARLDGYLPPGSLTTVTTLAVSFVTGAIMLTVVHRLLPNANQRMKHVWPGILLGALGVVALAQLFPIYLRLTQNVNRYGAVFGVIWLLLTYILLMAQILVFSTMLNAWWRWRSPHKTRAPIG